MALDLYVPPRKQVFHAHKPVLAGAPASLAWVIPETLTFPLSRRGETLLVVYISPPFSMRPPCSCIPRSVFFCSGLWHGGDGGGDIVSALTVRHIVRMTGSAPACHLLVTAATPAVLFMRLMEMLNSIVGCWRPWRWCLCGRGESEH